MNIESLRRKNVIFVSGTAEAIWFRQSSSDGPEMVQITFKMIIKRQLWEFGAGIKLNIDFHKMQ